MKISLKNPLCSTTLLILALLCFRPVANAQVKTDTVKIMAYNILNYPGSTAAKRNPFFKKIIEATSPDVLTIGELIGASANASFLTNVLNANQNIYATSSNFIDAFDTDNGIYFKKDKFSIISNKSVNLGSQSRIANEFMMKYLPSGDTFYLYAIHLKASSGSTNETARNNEVTRLRQHTDSLRPGTNFMILGDFNIYGALEPAYLTLTDKGGIKKGYVMDPLNMPGNWNSNSNYAPYFTQSPRTRQFDGGSNGGMDDRFDMILYSQAVIDNGGMQILTNTMTAYGNDGNHFNDSINRRPNTAVGNDLADAIHYASDHIPIYCNFTFTYTLTGISTSTAKASQLSIYPNPTTSTVNIKFDINQAQTVNISVMDMQGRTLINSGNVNYIAGEYIQNVSLSGLQKGIYLVKFQTENSLQVARLIVE